MCAAGPGRSVLPAPSRLARVGAIHSLMPQVARRRRPVGSGKSGWPVAGQTGQPAARRAGQRRQASRLSDRHARPGAGSGRPLGSAPKRFVLGVVSETKNHQQDDGAHDRHQSDQQPARPVCVCKRRTATASVGSISARLTVMPMTPVDPRHAGELSGPRVVPSTLSRMAAASPTRTVQRANHQYSDRRARPPEAGVLGKNRPDRGSEGHD